MVKRFGMEELLEDVIVVKRLCWLGHVHVARMGDERIPKKVLFGWLPQCCPAHETKMRWRDRVRKDLRKFHIDECIWFREAQERDVWRDVWRWYTFS